MRLDLDRVRENARQAETDDLLDRVTVYREGMEPQALEVIEAELRSRGVTTEQIVAHEQRRQQEVLRRPDGATISCSFCHAPAMRQGWAWHRLWGVVPVFPRLFYYCGRHAREPC